MGSLWVFTGIETDLPNAVDEFTLATLLRMQWTSLN